MASVEHASGLDIHLKDHAECVAMTGLARHLAGRRAVHAPPRRLRAGEVLYRAGDPTDRLYLVTEGVVHTSLTSVAGRELRLGVARGGEAVGELCFCGVRQRRESAVASTAAVVVPVPGDEVVRYAAGGADAALEVLEYLFHRIAALTGRLEGLAFDSARERLVRRILDLSAGAAPGPGVAVTLAPRSHQEWAAEVYATREQVSLILADLRRQGAVDYRGHPSALTVYPERLRHLAQPP